MLNAEGMSSAVWKAVDESQSLHMLCILSSLPPSSLIRSKLQFWNFRPNSHEGSGLTRQR